jgi:hypothetical protein
MENNNRVGFKRKDEKAALADVPAASNVPAPVAESEGRAFPISSAQADLIETIENLSSIIADKKFFTFDDNLRAIYVTKLVNAVALNSELSAKTMLLVG